MIRTKSDQPRGRRYAGLFLSMAMLAKLVSVVAVFGAVTLGDIEPAAAHSVAQVELGLGMTPATQAMLIDRGTGIQSGDILDYVLEFTPVDNGSLDGPGGYVTFYPPAGTQVVGASIVQPSGTDYVDVPVSPPGGIPGDAGDTHAPYNAPFDDSDPYDGGEWEEGTLPQFYADTGIFYSTSATTAKYVETMYGDNANPDTTALSTSNGYVIEPSACKQLKPFLGDPTDCRTHNLFDADNVSAWGGIANTAANQPGTSPHSVQANLSGDNKKGLRGRTAYLAGSPVAGPETFYGYDHTGKIGPWERIAYPGSTIGYGPPDDQAAPNFAYKSTNLGDQLSVSNPLPAATTAVRWAVGGLLVGELKYVKVDLLVLPTFDSSTCHPVDGEVFGGDAGLENPGKDNAWRYHEPAPANSNTCLVIAKDGPDQGAKDSDATFTITVSNVSTQPLTGVVVQDVLSPDMSFVSASPSQEAVSGNPETITWPTISLEPGETRTYEIVATLEKEGVLLNGATADSNETPVSKTGHQILVGDYASISHSKTGTPSVVDAGELVTYTIEVVNSGSADATDVTVTDTLDSGLVYESDTTEIGGTSEADPGGTNPHTWNLGTVAANSSTTLQFQARLDETSQPATCYYNDYAISWDETGFYESQTLYGVDTAEVCTPSPAPALNVVKSGPATGLVDDEVTYTFTVTNDPVAGDGSPISNVAVDDDVAGPATLTGGDTGDDGVLEVGETWTYTATYTLVDTDIGDLTNTVTVTGDDELDTPVPPAQDDHTTTVSARPAPALNVVKSGPATGLVDDEVTYTFTVTNDPVAGDGSPISNVAVDDDVAGPATYTGGDTGDDGVLEVGETWTYTATYTLVDTDIGDLTNTVTVTGDDELDTPVPPAQDDHTTTVSARPAPALNVVKSGPATGLVDDEVTYTFTVTNDPVAGDGSPISNVAVDDDVAGPGTYTGGDTGDDGVLEVGETWTYTATYTLVDTDIGDLTNTVTVTGDDELDTPVPPAQDDHTTTVSARPAPALNVVKSGPATGLVDDEVTYTFTVTNDPVAGDGSPISNVAVDDDVAGPGTYTTGDTGDDGVLEVGETWTYTATYTLVDTDIGDLTNTVTVTGDDELDTPVPPAQDDHTTTVSARPAPALNVVKSGPATGLVDDEVTYTFTVTNDPVAGDGSPISNVAVDDDVAGPGTYTTGDTGDDGVLEVGETWTYTATYTLVDTDIGDLTNTVTVTGDDELDTPVPPAQDDHTTTVSARPAPALNVVKSGPATGLVDDEVTYTFTVTNDPVAGDGSPISNVAVDDDVAGPGTYTTGDTGDDGVLEVGETWTYTATYTLVDTDIGDLTNTVTVTGDDELDTPVPPAQDDHTTTVSARPAPALNVVKSGPATGLVDDEVTYTFTVTNDPVAGDGSPISNVAVDDDVAGPGTYTTGDTGDDGVLEVGETWTYTATYTLVDTDIGDLTNTVTVTGDDELDTPVPPAQDDHTTTVSARPAPALNVVKSGPATGLVDDEVTYTFTVTNDPVAGDGSPISNVAVDDDVAGPGTYTTGDTGDDGVLEVGETWTYTATYTLVDTDIGDLTNTVTVTGDDELDTPVPPAQDDHTTTVSARPAPALNVVKSGPATGLVDDEVTYTFTVTNDPVAGDGSPISNVAVDDDVAGPGTYTGGDTGDDGVLEVGETWTYTATYTLVDTDIGDLTNTVTVTGDDELDTPVPPAQDDHTTTVSARPAPALNVVKSGPATGLVDDEVTYTFTVTNDPVAGDGSPISNVAVDDDVAGPGTYTTGDTGDDGVLEVGETWTYTATYTLVDTDIGDLTNTVTVTGDDELDTPVPPAQDDHTTTVSARPAPALNVVKSGPATGLVDDEVTYTFTVTNDPVAGDGSPISNVAVDDDVAGPGTYTTGDTGDDGVLEVGETWTYTATYTLVDTDIGDLTNTVTVTGDDELDTPVPPAQDDHTTTVSARPAPALNVVKSGPATGLVDDEVTYTFTVTNDPVAGDGSPISNVAVDDDVAGPGTYTTGDTGDDGVLEVGETWTYTATYTLVDTDIGDLTNTVTVTGDDELDTPVPPAQDDHTTTVSARPAPVLNVVKSGPATGLVDDEVTYTFTVTNDPVAGDGSPISNVAVDDDVAGPATLTGGDTGDDGVLEVGETWTYTATYTLVDTDIGDLTNTVTVTGDDELDTPVPPAQDDHTTTVSARPAPALNVVKSGPATGLVDDEVTYTFTVTNDPVAGDGSPISNVAVDDDVAGPATLTGGDTGDDGVLEVGETWTYTATYTLVDTDIGDLTNTVTVTGDDELDTPVPPAQDDHTTTVSPLPASIGDLVWNDLDRDGVRDSGEPGLGSVVVNLLDNAGNVVDTMATDTDGAYLFVDVVAATYAVQVDESTVPTGYVLTTTANPVLVTPAPGEAVDTADFGYMLSVVPVGTIEGRVFYDNDSSADLNGSEVGIGALTVTLLDQNGDVVASTVTQTDGSYRFNGVPVGDYTVDVNETDPDLVAAAELTTNNDPQPATATEGGTTVVPDVGYVTPRSSMSGTVIHDVDRDATLDSGEPGLPAIPVDATWAGPDGVFGTADDVVYSTTTSTDGSWSISGIPAGEYTIQFDSSAVPYGITEVSFSTQNVTVPPGTDVDEIDAGLVGTATLGNLVYADLNKNGVLDGQETGVGGVVVLATWEGFDGTLGTADDVTYSATTDALGAWMLTQIPAGEYVVSIDPTTIPANLAGTPSRTAAVLANATTNVDLPVVPTGTPPTLAFTGSSARSLVAIALMLLLSGSAMLLWVPAVRGRKT